MAYHENRHTGRLQRTQDLPERLLELRVQPLRRFVEEQNVRVQKQDLCQRRTLLFAARKVVGMAVKQLCQFTEGHDLRQTFGFALRFR